MLRTKSKVHLHRPKNSSYLLLPKKNTLQWMNPKDIPPPDKKQRWTIKAKQETNKIDEQPWWKWCTKISIITWNYNHSSNALTLKMKDNFEGSSTSQCKARATTMADIICWSLELCRIEFELPSNGFAGPSAIGVENPPLVLELELFQNITCLEPITLNNNLGFFWNKYIQILTFLQTDMIHYLQDGIHQQRITKTYLC